MNDWIIVIIVFLMVLWMLFKHYEPKIEVVVLIKRIRVYLWYNKWDGPYYKGRVYKYLFEYGNIRN